MRHIDVSSLITLIYWVQELQENVLRGEETPPPPLLFEMDEVHQSITLEHKVML